MVVVPRGIVAWGSQRIRVAGMGGGPRRVASGYHGGVSHSGHVGCNAPRVGLARGAVVGYHGWVSHIGCVGLQCFHPIGAGRRVGFHWVTIVGFPLGVCGVAMYASGR